MAYEGPRSHRPLIMGRRGAVASNHPLATQAGLLALQAGGNAVDAAVAVAATLAVVEPFMSGLGGDGFYHVHMRRTGESLVFNGTGPAPRAATTERYAAGLPPSGPLAVSVPGSVGAWGAMHARFGLRPWTALFEAAVHYAQDGFGVTRACRHFAGEQVTSLRGDSRSARVFLRDGRPPGLGTPIVQADLARTLDRLAAAGADDFYRGDIARQLAAGCQAAGSLVGAEDLAAFVPEVQVPIELAYRGFTVREAPPNSMGWVLLQELGIVEHFDLAAMGPLSADLVHTLVEAKKLAFTDRDRWSGDPRFFEAPLAELPLTRLSRRPRGGDRPQTSGAGRRGGGHGRRGHDLLLRGGRRRQRGVRDPESQQRVRVQRHRRGHRHPAEQPDDALARRAGSPEPPGPRQAGPSHDESPHGVQGRRAVGRLRHAGRRLPGPGEPAGSHRDGGPRLRPPAGGGDAALVQHPARARRRTGPTTAPTRSTWRPASRPRSAQSWPAAAIRWSDWASSRARAPSRSSAATPPPACS